jgi:hypothetical protein
VREDITWKDVVKNYKESPPFSATQKVVPELKKDHSLLFSTVPSRDEEGKKVVRDEDVGEDDEEEKKEEKNVTQSMFFVFFCLSRLFPPFIFSFSLFERALLFLYDLLFLPW